MRLVYWLQSENASHQLTSPGEAGGPLADECTLLAGIPNAPSAYALSEHSELARKRQEHVLEKLVAYDYLERGDARLIVARAAAKEPPAWQSA